MDTIPICEAEHGDFTDATASRLKAAYEAAGVEFTDEIKPGVRMKKGRKNVGGTN
jgi:hypothetical protein